MADPITLITGVATALTGAASYESYKSTKKASKLAEQQAQKDQKGTVDVGNPNDALNRAAAQRRALNSSETRLSTFLSNSSGGLG